MLTNADLRFPETQTDDGSTVILTESRYNQLIRSQNPVVRKEAFHHLFTTYAAFAIPLPPLIPHKFKAAYFTPGPAITKTRLTWH